MTLEDALGRPIGDLEDATMAHILFPLVKHGTGDLSDAEKKLNNMSNQELLMYISLGLSSLLDTKGVHGS